MEKISRSEFISMIFVRISIASLAYPCWLKKDQELLHTAMHELQQKYQATLPQLKKLHFATAGAYPYSQDLADDMSILSQSGYFDRLHRSNGEIYICHHPSADTITLLDDWRSEAFANDEQGWRNFCSLADELMKKLRVYYP